MAQTRSLPRLAACTLAALAALASSATTATAAARAGFATEASTARPWVAGNHTVPAFNRADAITETVDVQTGYDRDRNGKPDAIRVEITRPTTAPGAKVPLIIHASPYFFKDPRSAWETDFFVPFGQRRLMPIVLPVASTSGKVQ